MTGTPPRRIFVGVSGASGAPYAVRLVQSLAAKGLVKITKNAIQVTLEGKSLALDMRENPDDGGQQAAAVIAQRLGARHADHRWIGRNLRVYLEFEDMAQTKEAAGAMDQWPHARRIRQLRPPSSAQVPSLEMEMDRAGVEQLAVHRNPGDARGLLDRFLAWLET